MKRLSIYMLAAGMAALSTSCSDFLDTVPKDQLAPSTTSISTCQTLSAGISAMADNGPLAAFTKLHALPVNFFSKI